MCAFIYIFLLRWNTSVHTHFESSIISDERRIWASASPRADHWWLLHTLAVGRGISNRDSGSTNEITFCCINLDLSRSTTFPSGRAMRRVCSCESLWLFSAFIVRQPCPYLIVCAHLPQALLVAAVGLQELASQVRNLSVLSGDFLLLARQLHSPASIVAAWMPVVRKRERIWRIRTHQARSGDALSLP